MGYLGDKFWLWQMRANRLALGVSLWGKQPSKSDVTKMVPAVVEVFLYWYFAFVPWSTVKLLSLHTHREGTSFALASFLIGSSVRSAHAPSATNSREASFLPTCRRPVFVTTSQGSNVTSWRLTSPAEARRSWANVDPAKHKSMCRILTLGIIIQLY